MSDGSSGGRDEAPAARRFARPALVAGAGYLAMVLLGAVTIGGEIFPFFDWDLFSRVPQQERTAEIVVERVTGTELDEPVPLMGSGHLAGSAIVASQLAGDLRKALLASDHDRAAQLATTIERNHLPPDTRWRLEVVEFRPVDRFLDGTIERSDTVDTFDSTTPDPLD